MPALLRDSEAKTTACQNRMRTLLLSAILYLLGVALVLFFRPRLMFHEDGRWKEFGTVSPDHTVFPFWLFCILWAAVAYLISVLGTGEFTDPKRLLTPTEPPEDLVVPLPPKTRNRPLKIDDAGDMAPGYYVLNTKELKRTGVPKYIYMGEEAPPGFTVGHLE